MAVLGRGADGNPNLPDDNLDELWSNTIREYMGDSLWLPRDAYDAAHVLMVPLHVAFESGNTRWQTDFHDHFECFSEASGELTTSRLHRLHYMYLVSRYVVLYLTNEHAEYLPVELLEFVSRTVTEIWQEPSWQWESTGFPTMEARLSWKLAQVETDPSCLRAVIDEETFTFAVAADVSAAYTLVDSVASPAIHDILDWAETSYTSEVVSTASGGCLIQPGVWTDHRDYAYAGNDSLKQDMEPNPVIGIAVDSSHSHRLARHLLSLRGASVPGSPRAVLYDGLIARMTVQLLNVVVAQDNYEFAGVMLYNFMDGSNGVYRWGYVTQGEGNGYGPYELSGTFNLGWWVFLRSQAVSDLYERQMTAFALADNLLGIYVGPNTTRDRHPLVTLPESYSNGLYELIINLASQY